MAGPSMKLHLLPTRTAGAAENMACDFMLLQRYPDEAAARFRHYEWRAQAFTFGYSQKIEYVRSKIEGTAPNSMAGADAVGPGAYDLCRRPTGGGIVDHRQDWTYALVIPRGHALEAERASASYRVVHDCMAEALRAQGVEAKLQSAGEGAAEGEGVCFQRAEIHDVVHTRTGEKISGAAQKRNKRGLLFQGSIWRPAAGAAVDWERFSGEFTTGLAAMLGAVADPTPWPEFDEDELGGLAEKYASPEWLESR
jgi:lipoate-protein ligase A